MKTFNLKHEWFALLCLVAGLAFGIWAYPQLPDQIPSHWNIQGQVDAYTTPAGHLGMFGGLFIGIYLLFALIPILEPRQTHLAESIYFLRLTKNLLLAFFLILFASVTLTALGLVQIDIPQIISWSVGIMFVLLGSYMGRIKSNFFMGIRTPWTLSSDTVWQQTHRLGSILFILAGVSFIVGSFLSGPFNFIVPISLTLLAALGPTLYSYWLYRQS